MVWLHKLSLRRRWYTPTACKFVANKPKRTRRIETVAAAVVKGPIRVRCHSITALTPVPLVFEGDSASVFKRGDNVLGGETPGVTFLSEIGPM